MQKESELLGKVVSGYLIYFREMKKVPKPVFAGECAVKRVPGHTKQPSTELRFFSLRTCVAAKQGSSRFRPKLPSKFNERRARSRLARTTREGFLLGCRAPSPRSRCWKSLSLMNHTRVACRFRPSRLKRSAKFASASNAAAPNLSEAKNVCSACAS